VKEIKCVGGSTKGLHVHLLTKHSINLLKAKPTNTSDEAASGSSTSTSVPQAPKKKIQISEYFCRLNDKSLAARLARMTACDGLLFRVFCTSKDLWSAIMALGHDSLPSSPHYSQP